MVILRLSSVHIAVITLLALLLSGCQRPKPNIVSTPLPYQNKLGQRQSEDIDIVVIHATETPTLKMARELGEKIWYSSGTGNSGHYYIDRDGKVLQYVDDTQIAHHIRRFNQRSIGIELINVGRYPDWYSEQGQMQSESFTPAQIDAVIKLINTLAQKHPSITTIAGHQDLDPDKMPANDNPNRLIERKVDPGPFFPWEKIMKNTSLKRWNSKDDHLNLFPIDKWVGASPVGSP